MLHLSWILPLILLLAFMSSPRFRGDVAESRVRRLLAAGLERNLYTVFNDLAIPSGGGTTVIDHVVVSRFGIFVIESCYARGWISGTAVQAQWRRRRWGRTTHFDNPAHRNRMQVEALQRLLDYPARDFVPLVVMVGHRGFRTPMPDYVVDPDRLLAAIRKKSHQALTGERADDALRQISAAQLRLPAGWAAKRGALLRGLLAVILLGGLWLAFSDDLGRIADQLDRAQERRASPEQFHPDGSRKTEREIWEDSLVCAFSPDTGRCSCYESGGERADVSADACRRLANRGSILER